MAYPTIDDARGYLRGEDTRTTRLHVIGPSLNAAISAVEGHCGRTFAQVIGEDDDPTERTYTATADGVAHVDDFWSDDLVVAVNGRTITSYTLEPANGVCDGVAGFPWWVIRSASIGKGDTVTVEARWGWEETPAPVAQAVLSLCATINATADTPLGVVGMGEFGAVRAPRNLLAMVQMQLAPYRKAINVVPSA
jgi:hypothetical protein